MAQDPRIEDVLDSMNAVDEISASLPPSITPPHSASWLHGLIIGLRLAESDAHAAVELLRALEASELGGAVNAGSDPAYWIGLLPPKRQHTN
jgi:hypothetical protein